GCSRRRGAGPARETPAWGRGRAPGVTRPGGRAGCPGCRGRGAAPRPGNATRRRPRRPHRGAWRAPPGHGSRTPPGTRPGCAWGRSARRLSVRGLTLPCDAPVGGCRKKSQIVRHRVPEPGAGVGPLLAGGVDGDPEGRGDGVVAGTGEV